jgi:hypothetical protein
MKEIKPNLSRHESDLTLRLSKRLEIDSYSLKSIEVKKNFTNFTYADCHDV